MSDFIFQQVAKNPNYEKRTLDVPDTEFENREEPDLHQYRSATGGPRVVLYELCDPARQANTHPDK